MKATDITNLIAAAYNREKRDNERHQLIKHVLDLKWAGKKLTAKLANDVLKAKPELEICRLKTDFGLWQLEIGSYNPNADEYSAHYLAHANEARCYDTSKFLDHDCCHGGAAVKRNAKRLVAMNDLDKAQAMIDAKIELDKAKAKLDALLEGSFENPDFYAIERYLGLRKD